MAETEENLVDQKQNEKNMSAASALQELGDIKGFLNASLYFTVAIVVVGYVGATVINITNLSAREIDDLFPTNIKSFPYNVPDGLKNPSGDSLEVLFSQTHATRDAEALTKATIEFIFPMKRLSFPYSSWFLSPEFKGTKGYILAKWFATTCAGTFCVWRNFYKILIVLGKWFHTVAYDVSDLFLFYIFSYIVIYIILLPIIPLVGAVIAMMASSMYNIPGAWILTFAPFMGCLLAIANIVAGGFFNLFAWVMAAIIFILGYALGWVNILWWLMIGGALWLYTVAFMVISPMLHKGGMKNVVNEFIRHKKSLLAIFTVLIVFSAFSHLNSTLSTGFVVGALLVFYMIFKMPTPPEFT